MTAYAPRRRTVLQALAAGALTPSCARRGDPNTLTFWAMGREGEVVRELLPAFEAANPGVRVVSQTLPWTAAHERLLTAFVGDSLPDVAQLGNTWISEFSTLNALDPLDARIASSAIVDETDYFPGIWRTNVNAGRLYGVPWYVDTRVVFYRQDLLARAGFARVPETWAGWRDAMTAIKAQAGAGNYAALLPLNEFEPLLNLAIQQPATLLRENNTRGNFQHPAFKQTLAFYLSLFEQGLAPRSANTEISNVYAEFDRGFFSFYITGPWNIGEFKRRLPADRQHIWMTAPLPGPDGPGASVAGGASLVTFAHSPRKDLAWRLIEFLSTPETQALFHDKTGDLPARRSAWGALENDPYAHAFAAQLERARPAPAVPEWERIADELRVVGERMARGEFTVEAAAATLDARADRILEKRRWMATRGRAA